MPILRKLWDRFDFSFQLSQSGIYKLCGVPTWLLSFIYVMGLITQCSSVLNMSKLASKDELLKPMFSHWKIANTIDDSSCRAYEFQGHSLRISTDVRSHCYDTVPTIMICSFFSKRIMSGMMAESLKV